MPWTAWWIVVASLATPGQSVGPMVLERDAYGRVSVEVGLGASGPYRFLIDTGASLSSIAPRVADRLGLPDAGRVCATSVGDEAVMDQQRHRLGLEGEGATGLRHGEAAGVDHDVVERLE